MENASLARKLIEFHSITCSSLLLIPSCLLGRQPMRSNQRYSEYYSMRNTIWRFCDSLVLPVLLLGFCWSVWILVASFIEMASEY